MPLVAHSDLPAFDRLRLEGIEVAEPDQTDPDLADMHLGLLNLMPDAALEATDRQFLRLVSAYGDEADLYVHSFTLAAQHRSESAQKYVLDHYATFDQLTDRGLDALIVTGANPTHFELADEPFWAGLVDVLDWGEANVHSILCSCLATHAVLEHGGLVKRSRLPEKRWGVYLHELVDDRHPLVEGLDSPVEAPHSHYFDVTRDEMERVGLQVLVFSQEAGVHMASSGDGFSYVFFQGHPEYDDISLLKEYKREVGRCLAGHRPDYPPFPDHYFDPGAQATLNKFRDEALAALQRGSELPEFPEDSVVRRWTPDWSTQGQTIYANWLAEVARRVSS